MWGEFTNWLWEIINSFAQWILSIVLAIIQFVNDFLLNVFELILAAMRTVIGLIPMPDILAYSLNDLFLGLPDQVMYFLDKTGFSYSVAVFSSAFLFRIVRKFATLFQW